MGCGASSKPVADSSSPPKNNTSNFNIVENTATVPRVINSNTDFDQKIVNKKCPLVRLDVSKELKEIPVEGKNYNFKIKYCYASQRGYYPNSLNKANQDSYLICEGILSDPSCSLFGVFDGHGETGDYCSHFAADNFSNFFVKDLKSNKTSPSLIDDDRMKEIYSKAFISTNNALHKNKDIDDTLSGTTGVTILVKGDKLFVANVGDSRAIIASEVNGKLKYSALSSDQTPYRKDERERIKKSGGIIMTIDQIEGNEPIHENWGTSLGDELDEVGDPPRVWDNSREKPGCAFTRSIGDSVAESCGVYADPEMLEWKISPQDKFAVVASDGVFEFITSQNVVEMIAKYQNPIEAAKHVVAEAYRLWLTFDERTDDITIIIVYFSNVSDNMKQDNSRNTSPGPKTPRITFSAGDNVELESRPVRKVMSKEKRKEITETFSKDDNEDFDFDSVTDKKSPEDMKRLTNMIKLNFMFEKLSSIQQEQIVKAMSLKVVKANESIIKEGDQGDEMYIVDSGEFNVLKKDDNGNNQVVFAYTQSGAAFGELSLMYGKPRAASVIAKTNGKIWSIGRSAFRSVTMKGKKKGLLRQFQTVPVLSTLTYTNLQRICMSSKEVVYPSGTVIINESMLPNCNWMIGIVLSGSVRMIAIPSSDDKNDGGKKRQIRNENCFFCSIEIGTKYSEAKSDENKTKVVYIAKDIFFDILGHEGEQNLMKEVMKNKMKGKRLDMIKEVYEKEEYTKLEKLTNREAYKLSHPISFIGDFGYVGSFKLSYNENKKCSMKVIAKEKANMYRMAEKLLFEKQFLSALTNSEKEKSLLLHLSTISACFQDKKVIILKYDDLYMCDLSVALHNNCIPDESKRDYVAAIFDALSVVHRYGLIHRYVNSSSVYITATGVPKLSDFRFATPMNGSKHYTICGNPLFFAPEMVSQQGYDYSVDLWAFGVLFFEIYEGVVPFGNNDADETVIFKSILAHTNGEKLSFSNNKSDKKVKHLIRDILNPNPSERFGYADSSEIKGSKYFEGISWNDLNDIKWISLDIQPTLDVNHIVVDEELVEFSSAVFDQF